MRRAAPLLLSLLVGLGAAACRADDQAFGDGILVCYPNAPGSRRSAEPVMKQLGEYLTPRLEHGCQPVYFNEERAALEWLAAEKPRFAIVSLALYLRWRERFGLEPVAQSERGHSLEDSFTLLVRQDSPARELADLRPAAFGRRALVWSGHLESERFATRVVFGGKLEAGDERRGDVQVVDTRQTLGALRRLKEGTPYEGQPVDAVLVNANEWSALQELSLFAGGVLRPLYTSPPLPTPLVVAFGGVPAEERERLRAALVGMSSDPAAAELLETLQVTGFRDPAREALAAVVASYGAEEAGQ